MIEIYKSTDTELKEGKKVEKDSWINVVNPTNGELTELSKKLDIPMSFLSDPLDVEERSRFEIEGECVLTVLRVPYYDEKDTDVPLVTVPLGIIFNKDFIVTISPKELEIFPDFIKGRVKNFTTKNRTRFFLQISLKMALLYTKYLKDVNKKRTEIEKDLYKSMKNEALIKLVKLQKSLIYFTTSLKSNELTMRRLERTGVLKMSINDEDIFEDAIIENKQAHETAEIYSNLMTGMMDAFASIISNNVSFVVKFLTAITIVLTIPTIIASYYGMNVELPLQHSEHAFSILIALSVILAVISIVILWRKELF